MLMNVSAVSMTVSEMWPCVPTRWDLTLVPVTMVTLGTERRAACRRVGVIIVSVTMIFHEQLKMGSNGAFQP